MKQVWKFPLAAAANNTLLMPEDAIILSLQAQNDDPCIWALVDPETPIVERYFVTYGTGHVMPDDPGVYVGTTLHLNGQLVFHTFEILSAL